jgi:hypothetical protein
MKDRNFLWRMNRELALASGAGAAGTAGFLGWCDGVDALVTSIKSK